MPKTASKTTTTAKVASNGKAAPAEGKAGKGGKAAVPTGPKGRPSPRLRNGLGPNAVKVLQALQRSNRPMSRKELAGACQTSPKGWSKLLGATTKDDGGVAGDASLTAKRYITANKAADSREITYTITGAGKQALAKALKE